jgi:hypothetical protein
VSKGYIDLESKKDLQILRSRLELRIIGFQF